jgi:hypothetical protein
MPLVLIVSTRGTQASIATLQKPGKKSSLLFASPGNGTLAHLVGKLRFKGVVDRIPK